MIEIYYNGIWNAWKYATIQALVLYNNGDENIEVTQGWECLYSLGGTFTKNDTEMVFHRTEQYKDVIALARAPFDVTKYSKVTIEYYTESSSVGNACIGRIYFYTNFDITTDEHRVDLEGGIGIMTKTLNIAEINGEFYIGIGIELVNNKVSVKSIKLHN